MYAKRAYDDPVYLQADGTYSYSATAAAKDSGYAVVNTYFGDLGSGSLGTDNPSGGSAVITSFRHLYNIRMLQAYTYSVNYKISRNLNWYTTTPSGYKSDVRVYSANVGETVLVPASPVPAEYGLSYGSRLGVVSFPAIPSLNSHRRR